MPNKCSFLLLFSAIVLPNQVFAEPLLNQDLAGQTVFSKTYTTTGANSVVFGDVLAGGVSTTGANSRVSGDLVSAGAATTGGAGSRVDGDIVSGDVATTGDGSLIGGNITASGASTIGANSHVAGNMISDGVATTGDTSRVGGHVYSGGAASTGANSTVVGAVAAMGAISVGANSVVGSTQTLTLQPFAATTATAALVSLASSVAKSVLDAQAALNKMGAGTLLAATMTTDTTLYAGVYSAASLSTTAGTTLTLDGKGQAGQFWVFNIADILAIGASTKIVLKDFGLNSSVIWNTGGYASLGANSYFIGTVFAQTYISVGADTVATGVGSSCGGLYSATSYVSTGDGSRVGRNGCTGADNSMNIDANGVATHSLAPVIHFDTAVPEPGTWAMMLVGLGLVGSSQRRRPHRPEFVTA